MSSAPPDAAPTAPAGLRSLWDLARRWEGDWRRRGAAAEIQVLLARINEARASGPDFLDADVKAAGIPELREAALSRATDLYGPDARLRIEEIGTVGTWSGSLFKASIRVRCLNYAEIAS